MTGGGLTSYSVGGFVFIGQPINGRSALVRLEHRRYCAERLEALGCRTAPVVALFELPGERAPLPGGTDSAAGLAVRGFRCVLRVRQLDPVASFYQSLQHSALIAPALLQRQPAGGTGVDDAALLTALEAYAWRLRRCAPGAEPAPARSPADRAARQLRQDLLREYAPLPVAVARARVSRELGRIRTSSRSARRSTSAGSRAKPVGSSRSGARHGSCTITTSRGCPANGIMTLVESNVTLLAEFPDLDTALFVDSPEDADALQIDEADQAVLRAGFPEFHAREVDAARRIVPFACARGDRMRHHRRELGRTGTPPRLRGRSAMNGMPAQPVDARLSAAVDRWLSGRNLRPLTLMRAALERLILDAACSPRSARAVAMVPRHPFLPELAWRQAHAPTVAYPGLPAPLTVARLFDAAGARPGELVLILDQPLGWFSLVGGAFAALSDARAVTVGSPPVDSGLVRGLLHEFRVEVADGPLSGRMSSSRSIRRPRRSCRQCRSAAGRSGCAARQAAPGCTGWSVGRTGGGSATSVPPNRPVRAARARSPMWPDRSYLRGVAESPPGAGVKRRSLELLDLRPGHCIVDVGSGRPSTLSAWLSAWGRPDTCTAWTVALTP